MTRRDDIRDVDSIEAVRTAKQHKLDCVIVCFDSAIYYYCRGHIGIGRS